MSPKAEPSAEPEVSPCVTAEEFITACCCKIWLEGNRSSSILSSHIWYMRVTINYDSWCKRMQGNICTHTKTGSRSASKVLEQEGKQQQQHFTNISQHSTVPLLLSREFGHLLLCTMLNTEFTQGLPHITQVIIPLTWSLLYLHMHLVHLCMHVHFMRR